MISIIGSTERRECVVTASNNDSVVLSGCGWVTPPAVGRLDDVLPALASAGPLRLEAGASFRAIPDEWVERYGQLSKEIRRDRGAWIAALAAYHAMAGASLSMDQLDGDRIGLVLGCGLAGQQGMVGFATEVREQSARFVSPIHFPQTVGNYVAGALSRGFGLRGPNLTLAGGVQSGLLAMIEGHGLIAAGEADVVLAGGAEQLTDALGRGLAGSGVVPAEGACLFIMERESRAVARGAKILAQIESVTSSADGGAVGDAEFVSCAGTPAAGDVFIEHWIGRSLGADAPAAVAAGIAAAGGAAVPIVKDSAALTMSIESVDLARDGVARVRVVAGVAGDFPAKIVLRVAR